jgi:outer membrane protein assembly factor BamB
LFLFLLVSCTPGVPPTPTPVANQPPSPPQAQAPTHTCLASGEQPLLLPGLRHGVNAFLFNTDTARVLTLAQNAHFGWLRQQIHWRDIQGERDKPHWETLDTAVAAANQAGFQLMLSVVRSPVWATDGVSDGLPTDTAAFESFMRMLAKRYAGRVQAYEIWNEPNLAVENGGQAATPVHYLAVLQAGYAGVRAGDPCALVLAAPLAATSVNDPAVALDDLEFYRQLYSLENGAFLHVADAVAVHPGSGHFSFDDKWPADQPEKSRHYFRHTEAVREVMQQHGDQRQVWITEFGWATWQAPGSPPPVSPQQQAEFLMGALRYTAANYPWVAGMFLWNLNFDVLGAAQDEKSTFSILASDWSPRPAYTLVQAYLSALGDTNQRVQPRLSDGTPFAQAWNFQLPSKLRTPPRFGPDGTIYIGSDIGRLYALTPDGAVRWMFQAQAAIRHAPLLAADGSLVFGDDKGFVYALGADGRQRWRQLLNGAIQGTPRLVGDQLYMATLGGTLARLSLAGQVQWQQELGVTPVGIAIAAENVGEPRLFVATSQGEVLALSAKGHLIWRERLGQKIATAPVLLAHGGAQLVLVGDGDGRLLALDGTSGAVRWQRQLVERLASATMQPDTPLIAAPPLVTDDGTMYLGGRDGSLTALTPDGAVLWRYASGSDISATPTLAPDGTLLVGLYDERLIALDRQGRVSWQIELKGAVRGPSALGPDGRLYVPTVGGVFYAFAPRS